MLLSRSRYVWFMTVSVVYVLLVLLLHHHLHRINTVEVIHDTVVEVRHPVIDDANIHVDEPRSLAFPVVGPCVGPSVDPPSRLFPLGSEWLYTAYFDDRLKSVHGATYIRVLAILRRRLDFDRQRTFYFRWPQSGTGNATTALAETYEMCENHGRQYGGWILSTKFIGQLPPCSVNVTRDLSATTQVRLPVFRMSSEELLSEVEEKDNLWVAGVSLLRRLSNERVLDSESKKRRGNFAVCVPPLYGALTPATLVQFVELTRLLGAQHFIFYVSGVSERVRHVLDGYEADGIVTTISWILPAVAAKSIWYNGQLLAANDCLYRTSHAFNHVAFNDVDEFIVPHSATNWSTMLTELAVRDSRTDAQTTDSTPRPRWADQKVAGLPRTSSRDTEQSDICGYAFRSAFFQTVPFSFQPRRSPTSAHSGLSAIVDRPSYDLRAVHRSAFSRVRSKVIVRPSVIFELGIHHISRPLYSLPAARASQTANATRVIFVPPDVGFVHHYRDCTNDYEHELDCNVSRFIVDATIADAGYIPTLRKRIERRLEAAKQLPQSTAGSSSVNHSRSGA